MAVFSQREGKLYASYMSDEEWILLILWFAVASNDETVGR